MQSQHDTPIPIFLSTDETYAPYAAIMMRSVLQHTRSSIHFHILDGGIHPETREKVVATCSSFPNATLEFIDMSTFDLSQFPPKRYVSITGYSRYFIAEIKPELSRALYMDVDIIAVGDIADLYVQPLGDYPIGAILEDYRGHNSRMLAGYWPSYKNKGRYFNSGVLLMNLEWFRQNDVTSRLVQLTHDMKNSSQPYADQNIFNVFFQDNVHILDDKFNIQTHTLLDAPELREHPAQQAIRHPVLLHFSAYLKPWNSYYDPYSKIFRAVAKETVFWKDIRTAIFSSRGRSPLAPLARYCPPAFLLLQRCRLAIYLLAARLHRNPEAIPYRRTPGHVRVLIRSYQEAVRDMREKRDVGA